MHELVIGRAEQRAVGLLAVAALIDERLRMLDAKSNRERLGLDEHAASMQHFEGVARAVADGEHEVVGGDPFAAGKNNPAHARSALAIGRRKLLEFDVVDARFEADLAAEGDDLRAHLLDHAHQSESSDVRLVDEHDLFRRAGLDELVEHFAAVVPRILDLAVEFAVGKCSRAAFAELRVRLGIEHSLAPHEECVLGALAHSLTALEDQWTEPGLREDESREKSGGAHADHDGALGSRAGRGRCLSDELVAHVGSRRQMRVGLQTIENLGFMAQLSVDGVDEEDRLALARVDRATEDLEPHQVVGRDAEPSDDRRTQRVLWVLERKTEFGEAKHG